MRQWQILLVEWYVVNFDNLENVRNQGKYVYF